MKDNRPDFDSDIESILNFRNKLNKNGYKSFKNLFDEFLKAADITDKLTYETPSTFLNYMKNESYKIERILNFLKNTDYKFNYKRLSDEFNNYILQLNIDSDLVTINDYKDFVKLNNGIINSLNIKLKQLWLYVVKVRIYIFASNIIKAMTYMDSVSSVFIKYRDLKTKRVEIPDILVRTISDYMMDVNYDTSYYGNDDVGSHQKYIEAFISYIKEYNEKTKEPNVVKLKVEQKEDKKEDKKTENIPDDNEYIIEEKQALEEIKNKQEKEEIDRWVKSYLPSICDLTSLPFDLSKILPQPYLKNYDQIMIELLKGYERYYFEKQSSTIIDFHIYQELQNIVESLKK